MTALHKHGAAKLFVKPGCELPCARRICRAAFRRIGSNSAKCLGLWQVRRDERGKRKKTLRESGDCIVWSIHGSEPRLFLRNLHRIAHRIDPKNPVELWSCVDRWGPEYASYNKARCEQNAAAENVTNVRFQKGDACKLEFADECFDAVTSNYVYHNITGVDKQKLLRETLRVLKKGGTFAIHDLMEKSRYGDMEKFAAELRAEGFEEVRLIPTANGKFMSKREGLCYFLAGSTLLVGKK